MPLFIQDAACGPRMARDWSPDVAIEEGIGAGNREEDDDD
jgi:hypothetical protein